MTTKNPNGNGNGNGNGNDNFDKKPEFHEIPPGILQNLNLNNISKNFDDPLTGAFVSVDEHFRMLQAKMSIMIQKIDGLGDDLHEQIKELHGDIIAQSQQLKNIEAKLDRIIADNEKLKTLKPLLVPCMIIMIITFAVDIYANIKY